MGFRGAFGLILALALPQAGLAACGDDAVELRGPGGQARFTVEIADTPSQQAQGLMFRQKMPASGGMLFIFARPKHASFWMKNTLIPLDMIFADSTGKVTRVHSDAIPEDETPIDGGDGVAFVLEINGGLAARLGIAEGTVLRHPRVDQATAAWPCSAP